MCAKFQLIRLETVENIGDEIEKEERRKNGIFDFIYLSSH